MRKEFFSRPAEKVAKQLLGAEINKRGVKVRIVETEAYLEEDPASHAYPRKTERNRLMYETYGKIYVYICYGIHNMLNFTTGENSAGAVLVRAAEPVKGIEKMKRNREMDKKQELCNGPSKLCEALGVDKEINGEKIGKTLELENRDQSQDYEVSTRIGISKAKDRKLRYYLPQSSFVSTH